MRKRGHKIYFAIQKNGELAKRARKEKFCVIELYFQKWAWIFSIFILMKVIIKNRISIINTHSSLDSWLGGIVGRILRKKIIRTRHLSSPMKRPFHAYILYNLLADVVITTCEETKNQILKKASLSANRCYSIPTGVLPEILKEGKKEAFDFRKKYHLKKTDTLVGFVGFMRSWKGVKDFLRTAELLQKNKNIKWMVIGGGHQNEYRKFSQDLHLKNVIFTGYLENPYSAIASLDVFMLLSTAHEGVSQAALQAAYLEKPLITTSTGGLKEICIDQLTGILVERFNPEKAARAVLQLQKDKDLRFQLGKKAKRRVLQLYTHSLMCDQIEKCYQQLLF
jgi:glycosyltransferase involved in cell wall biosynthesis